MLSFKATKKMQQKHPIVSCKKYICFSTARINFKRFVKPNYVTYAKQKLHFSPSLFFLEQNGVHQNDENSRKYSFPAQLFSYFQLLVLFVFFHIVPIGNSSVYKPTVAERKHKPLLIKCFTHIFYKPNNLLLKSISVIIYVFSTFISQSYCVLQFKTKYLLQLFIRLEINRSRPSLFSQNVNGL